MKRPLLLFAILLALFPLMKSEKAGAQITAVSLYLSSDSIYSTCSLPSYNYVSVYGSVTGTPSSPDSVTVYINTGDGFDTTFKTPISASGSGGYFSTYVNHTYTIPGVFSTYVEATTSGGIIGTATGSPVVLSDDCSVLSGALYVDNNGNCVKDAGEPGLYYLPLMVINTTIGDTLWGTWSDDTGHYAVSVPAGYTYKVIPNESMYDWWWYWAAADSNLTPTCPVSGTFTFSPVSGSTTTENFAYTCTPATTADVSAEGWGWGYVPGDTGYVDVWAGEWWWYYDYTCASLSSTVTLTLDPKLTYVGVDAGVAIPTVSGSTLTWTFSTAADMFYFYAYVRVVTSTSAVPYDTSGATPTGDLICNTVYASPTSLTDPDLTNNTYSWCEPVRASWDPNGKSVSPEGSGAQGYINTNLPMSYSIHFQNTGNAPASNVTVVDTISDNLDISTLHILQSSKPVTLTSVGNVVKFRFTGINLPDSASNPSGSIGTFSYGILQKKDLAPGTQIKNSASIYFDYNAAVKTNTTLNTIAIPTSVTNLVNNSFKATVYPNPANEEVTIQSADKSDFKVTMMDMVGRSMAANSSAQGHVTISTRTMPAGMYLIKVTDPKGNEVSTKVEVQH